MIEIKKVDANIGVNTDKVQTFYNEIRKKYQDVDTFNDTLQEVKVQSEQNSKDLDGVKNKISNLAEKDELDKLVQKVQKYVDALKNMEKSSSLTKDVKELKSMLDGVK